MWAALYEDLHLQLRLEYLEDGDRDEEDDGVINDEGIDQETKERMERVTKLLDIELLGVNWEFEEYAELHLKRWGQDVRGDGARSDLPHEERMAQLDREIVDYYCQNISDSDDEDDDWMSPRANKRARIE